METLEGGGHIFIHNHLYYAFYTETDPDTHIPNWPCTATETMNALQMIHKRFQISTGFLKGVLLGVIWFKLHEVWNKVKKKKRKKVQQKGK